MSWVHDASSVVCWLSAEPGAERVREILLDDEESLLHAVNLVEIGYLVLRRHRTSLTSVVERIRAARIRVVHAMHEGLLTRAIDVKANYAPIALGDSFAVALAATERATLVTTDRAELEKIAQAGLCRIEFLR